ncbi:hypothetical protein [Paraburkholderia sp. Ac-20347]|jgi:hypothetical protein|uniref:hypothetical protein n=1 Tax=Paraburkholderia sp. Ac-20347 TaxID=2703892 RepID=UPI00197F0F54|nr:hypothetical protein [Paraburkholderia sp. Ac-20347]MBN3807830.1 hypothetical protein [Paraburkholderia sp. Ac-20347]
MATDSYLTPEKTGWFVVTEDHGRYVLRVHASSDGPTDLIWRGRVGLFQLLRFVKSLAHGGSVSAETQTADSILEMSDVADERDLISQLEAHGIERAALQYVVFTLKRRVWQRDEGNQGISIGARVDLGRIDTVDTRVENAPDDIELTLPKSQLEEDSPNIAEFIYQTNRYPVSQETALTSLRLVSEALS